MFRSADAYIRDYPKYPSDVRADVGIRAPIPSCGRLNLDSPELAGMIGFVPSLLSVTGAEFLENYQRDVPVRWSPGDLAAQQEFVGAQIAGSDWLDWSTPAAALQLFQSAAGQVSETANKSDSVVLAGPIVELLDPMALLRQARGPLGPGGRLIGIIPCLRDNSPESDLFMQHARTTLWPYYTAEELQEMLGDTAWQIESQVSGFVPIPRFTLAALNDQLGFKGFNRVFVQLSAAGYDPMEVGWGELRFVARWVC